MDASVQQLIARKEDPELRNFSYADAIRILMARATTLDIDQVPILWQTRLTKCPPGWVNGPTVRGRHGMKRVRVAESQPERRPIPNRIAYTESEYDYMLVEVNTLYKRQHLLDGARKKYPFFCSYCEFCSVKTRLQ